MLFEPVIGLEVHVQLNTESKIFCGCSARFGSPSNTQTCPVCLGLPGVLPVLNEEVLKKAILSGLALGCKIAPYSKFDRKNYFYPDLPKAYQISQYDKPVCYEGFIEVSTGEYQKKIGITRIHIEEDAGKSIHSEDPGVKASYVDFNRTGVPLIEIVSEPDIRTSDEAYGYLQQLKTTLKYLAVSDCNMEEGSLRCDVNISLRKKGAEKFGQKVEIKNLNSFKAVKASIDYEIQRQTGVLSSGGLISQETRLWDAERNETFSMRSKEEAHDYRYFPDPDLPPVILDDEYISKIRSELPELPEARKNRYMDVYSISPQDARVLTSSRSLADYFESVLRSGTEPRKAANWILSEMLARVDDVDSIDEFSIPPEKLSNLLSLVEDGTISGKIAKMVFIDMIDTGSDAADIIREKGLVQVSDETEIEKIIITVIENNPVSVADYKAGKQKALGFLVGQVMRESKGKANPGLVNKILLGKLGS